MGVGGRGRGGREWEAEREGERERGRVRERGRAREGGRKNKREGGREGNYRTICSPIFMPDTT